MSSSLQLRIELDAGSGFCFGVVYAIELAEELLAERGYLYCLGDIVHNDEEVRRLQRLGLRIIDYEQLAVLRNETVLLRAHGEPPSTYQRAVANNLTLLDASCPVVLKLQNRIKASADRGEAIVLFGQPGHANEQDFNITSNIRSGQLKQDLEWAPRAGQKLRVGASATYYVLTPGYVTAPAPAPVNATPPRPAYALEPAAYASHEWAATDRLDFTLGLRASGFGLLGPGTYATYDAAGNQLTSRTYARGQAVKTYLNLEPRLAASYQPAPGTTLKAGYARNVQHLHLLSNSLASSPTDLYVPTSRNVRPERADLLSAGYFRQLGAKQACSFSAEVYYKWLQQQLDYRDGSQLVVGQDVESTLLYGRGRAYGLELLLRKDAGRLTGWVGYTLSKSQRQFVALNAGAWFNARQDRPHELSVVASYRLTPQWSLAGTAVASTGNAVTYPVGKTAVAGQTVSVYGPRNADRLPAYHRLDVGATYEKPCREGHRFHSSWNFSVYNALGRQNPFLITFETVPDDPTRTQAVQTALFRFVPSATYNFSF